ncbi:MAG: outer membrane protein assembly factor BamD [Candidatus Omnitrophica bacterium]|nr:outer membrane protein assembly factor BamD [Candidatus Omnitrophota bacterium]
MKKITIATVIACTGMSCFAAATFSYDLPSLDEHAQYSRAVEEVKHGNPDFAFLQFRELLDNFPDSKYAERSLFAVGEYYFQKTNFREASSTFFEFIDKYPDSPAVIFALSYLLQVSQAHNDAAAIEQLTKTIVTFHRLSLVFRNSQEYTYRSALLRKHRVIYYIDKVEFYINGELFAQIPY